MLTLNHMKLSCTQENLTAGLEAVSPVATRGGSLPILQNILLEAREGSLKLKATNLEIGVTAEVRGKIEQEGTFTVNGRLFAEYVRLLPGDKVDMELAGDHLEIRSGGQQTKIHGLSAEEFPVIPTVSPRGTFKIDAHLARGALSQVLFSVATTDTRPEISGALIMARDKHLTFVGTDSYRLAERSLELKTEVTAPIQAIIPLRTMQELTRMLSGAEGELEIALSDNQVLFSFSDIELVSRLIVGNFPDYTQIIPQNSKTTVTLDKEPLGRAIKSASLFCRSGLNHVTFQFSGDRILVSASASSVGENIVEVPAKVEGADTDIVFDYRFVLDGLSAISGSEVVLKLSGSTSPGVFTPVEPGYLYLVMPIRQ